MSEAQKLMLDNVAQQDSGAKGPAQEPAQAGVEFKAIVEGDRFKLGYKIEGKYATMNYSEFDSHQFYNDMNTAFNGVFTEQYRDNAIVYTGAAVA